MAISDVKFIDFLQNEAFIKVEDEDINLIRNVFGQFHKLISHLDFTELEEWLKRFHLRLTEIRDVIDLDPCVSLWEIALCFKHFGYPALGNSILLEKSFQTVSRCVPGKRIASSHVFETTFDTFSRKDVFKCSDSVVSVVTRIIDVLQRRIKEVKDITARQKYVDKTVAMTFALLDEVEIYRQNDILETLSLSIPHDVDKTCFQCLYFSRKALIASVLEDAENVALYQQRAEFELQLVSPCFVVGVARGYLALAGRRMLARTGSECYARHAYFNRKAYLDCMACTKNKQH